jgi:hypothetical protein
MLGAATAYNLKKWLNYQSSNRLIKINCIKKRLQSIYLFFLAPYIFSIATPVKTEHFLSTKLREVKF